jgi:hypothetical protein
MPKYFAGNMDSFNHSGGVAQPSLLQEIVANWKVVRYWRLLRIKTVVIHQK